MTSIALDNPYLVGVVSLAFGSVVTKTADRYDLLRKLSKTVESLQRTLIGEDGRSGLRQEVREIHHILVGVDGQNGIRSDVRALQDQIARVKDRMEWLERVYQSEDLMRQALEREMSGVPANVPAVRRVLHIAKQQTQEEG